MVRSRLHGLRGSYTHTHTCASLRLCLAVYGRFYHLGFTGSPRARTLAHALTPHLGLPLRTLCRLLFAVLAVHSHTHGCLAVAAFLLVYCTHNTHCVCASVWFWLRTLRSHTISLWLLFTVALPLALVYGCLSWFSLCLHTSLDGSFATPAPRSRRSHYAPLADVAFYAPRFCTACYTLRFSLFCVCTSRTAHTVVHTHCGLHTFFAARFAHLVLSHITICVCMPVPPAVHVSHRHCRTSHLPHTTCSTTHHGHRNGSSGISHTIVLRHFFHAHRTRLLPHHTLPAHLPFAFLVGLYTSLRSLARLVTLLVLVHFRFTGFAWLLTRTASLSHGLVRLHGFATPVLRYTVYILRLTWLHGYTGSSWLYTRLRSCTTLVVPLRSSPSRCMTQTPRCAVACTRRCYASFTFTVTPRCAFSSFCTVSTHVWTHGLPAFTVTTHGLAVFPGFHARLRFTPA